MEKEYTYMKKWESGYTIAIIHSFGGYYIARLMENGDRGFVYTIRRYKTLSGAEKYLINRVNYGADPNDPLVETLKGTEEYIKKGEYWK